MTSYSRLHIGLVTTSFPLRASSVSGIFVKRLVDQLPNDLKVTVVTPCDSYPPEAKDAARYGLVAFRYAPMSWQVLAHRPGGVPVALKRNRWLFLMLPPFLISMLAASIAMGRTVDVLHAQWGINGAVACLAGVLTGTPVITTLQGEDVTRTESSALDRWLLRWTLRRSARVVAVAEGQTGTINKCMSGEVGNVMVIPNAVEDAFLAIEKRETGDAGFLKLLFVGSLIPRKAVDIVLKAMAKVGIDRSISLVVAGDGPERGRLQALAGDLGLGESVRFEGMVPADKLPALYGATDALVLASHSEGLPNVVVEAMAAQVPVVATAIPGNVELIENCKTGLLFPIDDDEGLAAHLVRLRDDPHLRVRMGQAAREFVKDKGLTWSLVAQRYAELYQQVLGEA